MVVAVGLDKGVGEEVGAAKAVEEVQVEFQSVVEEERVDWEVVEREAEVAKAVMVAVGMALAVLQEGARAEVKVEEVAETEE